MNAEVTSSGKTLQISDGGNLYNGIESHSAALGALTSLEKDLVFVASVIYLSDLASKREEREQFVRTIELKIPVVNLHAFERIKDGLRKCLRIVSRDNWRIDFIRKSGDQDEGSEWQEGDGKTLLFSGGLDSLAGAYHLSEDQSPLALVSHVTHNQTITSAQSALYDSIVASRGAAISHIPWRVYGRNHRNFPFPKDGEREETQRTRSFLFLSLGAVVARRLGHKKIVVMAENGHFAIHLPLNAARIGPFSTHTANPDFLKECETVFRSLFESDSLEITNPFQYFTKGEVVALIPSGEYENLVGKSVSCWRASRVTSTNHCGECVPCLMRRISLECNGFASDETSRDLLNEDVGNLAPGDIGKRNFMDLNEFFSRFRNPNLSDQELLIHYPELFSERIDSTKAIAMYRRSAEEFHRIVARYPSVSGLIE